MPRRLARLVRGASEDGPLGRTSDQDCDDSRLARQRTERRPSLAGEGALGVPRAIGRMKGASAADSLYRAGQDGRIKARSSLAEACQHKPRVDDDRSARDVGTVVAPGPYSQVTLGPADRRCYPDRHRLLVRFENPDRAREVATKEPARSAGGAGTEEGRALSKSDLSRFSTRTWRVVRSMRVANGFKQSRRSR